jgi:hypothetical protein
VGKPRQARLFLKQPHNARQRLAQLRGASRPALTSAWARPPFKRGFCRFLLDGLRGRPRMSGLCSALGDCPRASDLNAHELTQVCLSDSLVIRTDEDGPTLWTDGRTDGRMGGRISRWRLTVVANVIDSLTPGDWYRYY